MVDPRLSNRRFQVFTQFFQRRFWLFKPRPGDLRQPWRKALKPGRIPNENNIVDLLHRSGHRFVDVGRLSVYLAVDVSSHLLQDPDIFQLHK